MMLTHKQSYTMTLEITCSLTLQLMLSWFYAHQGLALTLEGTMFLLVEMWQWSSLQIMMNAH